MMIDKLCDAVLGASAASLCSNPEVTGAIGLALGVVGGTILARSLGPATAVHAIKPSMSDRPPYVPGTPTKAVLPSSTFGTDVAVLDPKELKSCYKLMISTVTPRPIALVSSRSVQSGIDNVAPFSYFGAVAHNPPMVAIGFCRQGADCLQKDSIANILETKAFAVNIISEWYLDQANQSCGNYAADKDEFDESGLTKADCTLVNAPRVKEAGISYECQLEHVHHIKDDNGKPTTEIVLARIVKFHVDRELLVEGCDMNSPAVDTLKLRPVGRLGGNIYSGIGETLDIPRPKV